MVFVGVFEAHELLFHLGIRVGGNGLRLVGRDAETTPSRADG